MNWCFSKRILSGIDDSLPVFDLRNFKGHAKITSVYDGDTFNAVIFLHDRVLKFKFRTLGYDAPEMKPSLGMVHRDDHIHYAKLARDMFKHECGFDDREPPRTWNPFRCRYKVNGWIWIECGKMDKYGRPLVTVYKNKGDTVSVNDKMIQSGIVNVYDGKKKSEFFNGMHRVHDR
jgi:endonuclease YncB( thermonuclease family)